MRKINLLYGIWFGSVIGIMVNLSMNYLYFKGGDNTAVISFLKNITLSSFIGIFISLSGDYISILAKKSGIKKKGLVYLSVYLYYSLITVGACYLFNVDKISLYILAVLVVLIPSGTMTYIERLRAKEMNNNLAIAKERYKKSQGIK